MIAARVLGVSYQGSGAFRVANGDHHEDATIQRVGTGVPRVRRKGGHLAVLEIPTGLDDDALVEAVAEQLRALRAMLSATAPDTGTAESLTLRTDQDIFENP